MRKRKHKSSPHFFSVPRTPQPIYRSGISARKQSLADQMRANPTRLESVLKTSLALAVGDRFVIYSQWVERGYILDFYIRELRLCFEADGPLHHWKSDERRDVHLFNAGIRTVRFTENDLMDLDTVDKNIRRVIRERVALLK